MDSLNSQSELLDKRVSAEETRLLLERLGSESSGADGSTHLRDIAECTGVNPNHIDQLLTEIRSEVNSQKIDHQFHDHEARIEHLESTTARAKEPQTPTKIVIVNGSEARFTPLVAVLFLIGFIVFGIVLFKMVSPEPPHDPFRSGSSSDNFPPYWSDAGRSSSGWRNQAPGPSVQRD